VILLKYFIGGIKLKNDVGSSKVFVETEAETRLSEVSPVKKKGKCDRVEAEKKNVERVLELVTGGSFWDDDFDWSGFVKDFNLHEDFEAAGKYNHSNLFRDANVSCLCSMVLLEVM
jgi:hypothetical protein